MQYVKPSFSVMEQCFPEHFKELTGSEYQEKYIENMLKHIELCGRTCYKSTDKITDTSARDFVNRLIRSKHYSMLEHGTVYLTVPEDVDVCDSISAFYKNSKYSKVVKVEESGTYHITTNYRVIVENGRECDLEYVCYPTHYHPKRHTVRFICNRQVSHEFVRHRVFSFAQESTRYCNYTSDKFGNSLSFILPCELLPGKSEYEMVKIFGTIEKAYQALIEDGCKPQWAATILPNAIKTELIMTGFEEDWEHFFELRALGLTGKPHPQAEELAKPLLNYFISKKYVSEKFQEHRENVLSLE